jgi:deazaflavin-dependent oxidoreductase (nitroreductase family)
MTKTIPPEQLETYRQFFKKMNVFMLWMWRLGFRKWLNICPPLFGRILVITHIGRKSGMKRRTPVNFARIDGELYCLAGFGTLSDWYRNLQKTPQVEVWLPGSWWNAVAEDANQDARRLPILRQVIKDSGFAGFAFGVNAYRLSDAELDALTQDYRLLHLRCTGRRHGRGGPGDLAWVWLIPAGAALLLLLSRWLG